jgi:hypothetical protein
VGGRPADVACLQPIKADPLPPPPVTHDPRRFWRGLYPPSPLHNSSAWLVMPPVSLLVCASPAPFGTAPRRPRPQGPKGAPWVIWGHLKEETKMNNFLLHSSLIGVLGAEQLAPEDRRKFPEPRRPQIFGQDADILTSRASTTAGTVRERVLCGFMVVYMTESHYSLGKVTRTWSTLYLQRRFLIYTILHCAYSGKV